MPTPASRCRRWRRKAWPTKATTSIYGFAVETGMHMLRIIIKGVFDRFPKLQFVLGHCGQALPFWVFRINYMHRAGMASEPPIMLCHQVMGADRVMYAMDYPYQFVPEVVAISDALLMTALDKRKYFQLNAERVVNFSA